MKNSFGKGEWSYAVQDFWHTAWIMSDRWMVPKAGIEPARPLLNTGF